MTTLKGGLDKKPPMSSFSSTKSMKRLLLWYLLFGALHEVSHLFVAQVVGLLSLKILDDGYFPFLYRTLLGRQCIIPGLQNNGYDEQPWKAIVVRHSGWVFSAALALLLRRSFRSRSNHDYYHNLILTAAYITALEAISTDLFGWTTLLLPGITSDTLPRDGVFFCGNFGIILLHHAWLSREGETLALDILEKMVNVTMMRGAQSGGVVTFKSRRKQNRDELVGIRSRVVNKKRTDLSKLIRSKVSRDVFSGLKRTPSCYQGGAKEDEHFVPTYCGHTRFATSSKATFEGTHPQRWTPPSYRRVYDFSILKNETNAHSYEPCSIVVENYITHNGDFDFYDINGKSYDLEIVQKWLVIVTGEPMPAVVDSCAVAGIVDLLRTQGCFGLSTRYSICLGLSTSKMNDDEADACFPPYKYFEEIGMIFEEVLREMLKTSNFDNICDRTDVRRSFALRVLSKVEARYERLVAPISQYLTDQEEEGASLFKFVTTTVDAFFDNDLLNATKVFLENAKGSFGLCVTSSLDAKRQICVAARGQTVSIAFYPKTGLICYGSEQAAVKAGMNIDLPGNVGDDTLGRTHLDVNHDALRLDLDDLGGEVCLIDWGYHKCKTPALSKPNRNVSKHTLMNGRLDIYLLQESKATTHDPQLYHRMTRLTRNRFIKPLGEESNDVVLSDIQDIPKICHAIQDDWRSDKEAISLNRLTAWNLSRCLRNRLEARIKGTVENNAIDILLTGCEVSLWLAEQFASDLQKAFPKLQIQTVSSNKLLGLFGQEIAVPSVGFPYSSHTQKLDDAIVIIVSHSGGTFAPLACSSLFQSTTQNLFVVTSEWDTQVGKQLRNLNKDSGSNITLMMNSRIFSTEVGIRPAEPCSVSVVATHQLLTNIFEYISVIVLSDHRFRCVTGAIITEQDLQILEKCNQSNIEALTNIVGVDCCGEKLSEYGDDSKTEKQLRKAGDLWADHILENARAYIMTILYILITVISGYPLMYAILNATGYDMSNKTDCIVYLIRAIDALIYIWLPQINIMILRLVQQRNLRHRMVGRTVVIGDIPWVAQSAEAFLSKIFAVSYSIAGLNVLSGNPADHLVHRHTHRVVRGTLLICGRPDGRISALATAETATCLSVNQASSIQSLGGTCESVTIGHNPFKLPLSSNGIFLPRNRPLFLCERMLTENDLIEERSKKDRATHRQVAATGDISEPNHPTPIRRSSLRSLALTIRQGLEGFSRSVRLINRYNFSEVLDASRHSLGASLGLSVSGPLDISMRARLVKRRSSTALLGAYMNFEKETNKKPPEDEVIDELVSVEEVIERAIEERKWSDRARNLFNTLDSDGNGLLCEEEFVAGYSRLKPNLSTELLAEIFEECDVDGSGELDFDEYLRVLRRPEMENDIILPTSIRDSRGIIQVKATTEHYFGETVRKINAGKGKKTFDFMLARSQHFSQELYESRIASLQRFVSMTVMFHQMGSRVEKFFELISFGLLGYRMDRTHSIMRIATTASPVSGADVRQRMRMLQLLKRVRKSIDVISVAWLNYKKNKETERIRGLEVDARSKLPS